MNPGRPQILFPLFADVTTIKGVGPRVAESLSRSLSRSDGARVKDLLLTPPTGLIDRSYRPTITDAHKDEIATFVVTVGTHMPPSNKGRPYRIRVFDETGDMTLVFFKPRAAYLNQALPEGGRRIISGKTEVFNAELQMTHPDYIVALEDEDKLPKYETLYPLTAGLSQKVARKAVMGALQHIPQLTEWLDPHMIAQQDWPGFAEALIRMHAPDHPSDPGLTAPPRQRLAYDELFAKQLAMALVRENTRRQKGRSYDVKGHYLDDVLNGAPFPPTGAQSRAVSEIIGDLKSPFRMARLLQGDVGAGKTFVAAQAAAFVCESGAQVAIMAPTEILARQHHETLKTFLEPAGLTVEAITGRDKGKPREALATGLREGYIDVVVGTHALFQESVEFHDLGLVIIDEQHRFGVHDRLNLTQKGVRPDLLVMTATPIPRTLALTSYGDLDISKLDEKPAGRRPIETRILPLERLDNVIAAVGRAIDKGDQVYWVCPLVEDSEAIALTSVEDRHRQLTAIYGNRVGLLHGRLSAQDKEAMSLAFKAGEYDVLVATTVIEVGVDAPNATIMVIEHAERFGLAQLHQLRGRVGRSDKASSCLLLYKGPLGVTSKARLEIMRESEDGFLISEKDWELRGSGDLLGAKQSGLPGYKLADLDKHKALLETAVQDARLLAQTDPALETPRGKAARDLLYLFEQDFGIALMKAG